MFRTLRIAHALALALLLTGVACRTGAERPGQSARGSLTVFAAASLTEAFEDLRASLRKSAPGLSVTYSFGGSGSLVTQVQQGAPVDVIATADMATMTRLTDAGLVLAPATFARNTLEVLVAPGNPKAVRGLADLARPDVKVVLADDSVPVGRYAAEALHAAGTTVRPVSKEADARSAVSKVTLGEADATIVYVTDVKAAGAKGQGVEIPPAFNVVAEYPIAVAKATKHGAGAAAFATAVVTGAGQDALARRGFLPAA